jgi:hypothetical protein
VADKDFVVKNGLVVGDTATINGVQIDPAGAVSGQILKFDGTKFAPASDEGAVETASYTETIGDGTNSTYTVTHNLNTKDIVVTVRDANSPYDFVNVRWEATTENTVVLDFSAVVSPSSRRVFITSAGTLDYYVATIGNGSDSIINLDHNLGSRDVSVVVRSADSPYEVVQVLAYSPTAQRVTLDFSAPPSSNSLVASVYLPATSASYSAIVGDGSSTSFTITHNLNTRDVGLITRSLTGQFDLIITRWEATTANTATVYFEEAPSSNSRKITVFTSVGGSRYVPALSEIAAQIPSSSSAAGNTGDIAYDENYIYICVSTNTWKRAGLSTW